MLVHMRENIQPITALVGWWVCPCYTVYVRAETIIRPRVKTVLFAGYYTSFGWIILIPTKAPDIIMSEIKWTISKLKSRLKEKGIDFQPNARKAELMELL